MLPSKSWTRRSISGTQRKKVLWSPKKIVKWSVDDYFLQNLLKLEHSRCSNRKPFRTIGVLSIISIKQIFHPRPAVSGGNHGLVYFVPLEFCRLSPLSQFSILGLRSREGTMGLRERATWRCGNMYFPCLLRSVLIHILPMHLCLDLTLHTLCFASLSQLDFSVNGYCVFELLNALCLIHSIHSVSIVPEEDSSNSSISHFFLIW
jgi:hypothetical protein